FMQGRGEPTGAATAPRGRSRKVVAVRPQLRPALPIRIVAETIGVMPIRPQIIEIDDSPRKNLTVLLSLCLADNYSQLVYPFLLLSLMMANQLRLVAAVQDYDVTVRWVKDKFIGVDTPLSFPRKIDRSWMGWLVPDVTILERLWECLILRFALIDDRPAPC